MVVLYLKALHLIAMVAWFAGLFYLVRLFVYHAEALEGPADKKAILHPQYSLMERRLYVIITWPAMVLTLICGIAMLVYSPKAYLVPWIYVKLGLVAALVIYHLQCGVWMRRLAAGERKTSGKQFRMLNEIATLLLVAIVFLAVFRHLVDFLYGFLGLVAFGILLFAGIRFYKRYRDRNPDH